MLNILNIDTPNEIVFHFNKKHLEDNTIPMWVIKTKGQTHNIHHLNVDKGIGFSSKETPDNSHTFLIFDIFIIKYYMSKKLTTEEFIEKAKKIHNDKYDYSLVKYINNSTKIEIICPIHGVFSQRPNDHISKKCGCGRCDGKHTTTDEFIKKAKLKHNNFYNYDKVIYKNCETPVIITCFKHGDFLQPPYTHLQGSGCSKCGYLLVGNSLKNSTNTFISKAKKIHNDKYDYSLVEYINGKIKIKIKCIKHGIFEQIPESHLSGRGCPICRESRGEKIIRNILIDNNVNFIPQHKFYDCRRQRPLLFDFYLPDYKLCIEYDGKQHFTNKNGFFGSKNVLIEFNKIKESDKIKEIYCLNNNIGLIRIPYFERNIETIILNKISPLNLRVA